MRWMPDPGRRFRGFSIARAQKGIRLRCTNKNKKNRVVLYPIGRVKYGKDTGRVQLIEIFEECVRLLRAGEDAVLVEVGTTVVREVLRDILR